MRKSPSTEFNWSASRGRPTRERTGAVVGSVPPPLGKGAALSILRSERKVVEAPDRA